jgi:signal transduction histidine kinase
LLNLLSNSVKFTAKGRIELIVESNAEYLVFKVADTGIGIKPENQK